MSVKTIREAAVFPAQIKQGSGVDALVAASHRSLPNAIQERLSAVRSR
jgi:hypothetical protein